MSKGNFKAFTLSLIIHLSIVFALVSLSKPTSDPKKTKSKPVTSYLLIPPPKNTQKTSDTIDDSDNNVTESTLKREISPSPTDLKSEQDVQSEIVPNAASDETVQERQEREAEQKTTKKAIQTNPAQFIQNLNSEAINELAKNARITRGRPPLSSDSTSGSNNQREETPAQSFGPPGSDIKVMSSFGLDEVTILHGDRCYQLAQTALDDKVWRGRTPWLNSSSCNRKGEFDEQLQESLNKFMRR